MSRGEAPTLDNDAQYTAVAHPFAIKNAMHYAADVTSPPQQLDIEDHAALLTYLRDSGRIDPHTQPTMHTLAGGVSNRTVCVELGDGRAWVLKQALAKLRVAVDWFSDPARIEREAAGLRAFGELAAGSVPAMIFEDRTHHLLAMEAVPQPHANYKEVLLAGGVDADQVMSFAALLGQIHREGWRQRERYAVAFDDRSYFQTLRVEPYYHYAAAQAPAARAFIDQLIEQTHRRRLTIVHGDYSPKNVLIHQGRLILLDFEVIHFGDPAFDVGFAMTHYLSKAHHLPAHRAALLTAAQRFAEVYDAALGDVPWRSEHEPMCTAHTLGCMLARVRGRSPLEYLTAIERDRQCGIVLAMMQAVPRTLNELVTTFAEGLKQYGAD